MCRARSECPPRVTGEIVPLGCGLLSRAQRRRETLQGVFISLGAVFEVGFHSDRGKNTARQPSLA